MTATQTLEQWFEQADNALPVLTETARWAVVGLGLLLWIAGGKLVKPACITGGFLLGMILGGVGMAFFDSAAIALGAMLGLGLLGALAAWLMFRAWVALAAAVMLAIVAPAATLVWQGAPADELSQDTAEAAEQLRERYDRTSSELNDQTRIQVQQLIEQGDPQALADAESILKEQGGEAVKAAREVVFRNLEDLHAWWQSNQTQAQRTVGIAMLVGAGLGFFLGVLLPNYAVAVQSAIVGTVLIVIPGRELLLTHVPGSMSWAPTDARGTLITLGLITAVGVALQWRLYLRRDDKR